MIRAVLDTNVLVSALIVGRGALGTIMGAWRKLEIVVLTSGEQMDEIGEVLRRPQVRKRHGMSDRAIENFLEEFRLFSVWVEVRQVEKVIEDDPDDDLLLAVAETGGADYIVSGDHHLLALQEHHGIRIVSPGDFDRILKEAKTGE